MEGLFGPRLLKGSEEVPTSSLQGRVVGIYFSAHWCPPCQQYTPLLRKVYERAKAKGKSFDIVFVSSDKDEASFRQYFGMMPWHAVPFSNPVPKQALSQAFQIRGIPSLVLLTGTGSLLDPNAKAKAMMPNFLSTLPREIDVKDIGPLPADTVEVVVRHHGQEYTVECEPGEGWELFRMQIFSVTEVPAEKQRLFGLGVPHGPLDESVPLARAIAGGLVAQRGSGLKVLDVPDAARSASSSWGDDKPGTGNHRGRLDSPFAWVSKAEDKSAWYQMDLGEARKVAGVAIAARVDCPQFVTKFKVLCAEAGDGPWSAVDGGREFDGCRCWLEAPVRVLFAAPVSTRFVRIQPTAHQWDHSLRADVLLAPDAASPPPDRPPVVVVLGNFSAEDPFEVQQAGTNAAQKMIEEQHLAMLQAKLSSAPPRLQHQVNSLDHVRKYEDRALQRQALDDIPVAALDAIASEACGKEGYDTAFMRQVLRWFKHDFFKWTNAPKCEHCGSTDTKTVGATGPTQVEQQFGAGTVEVAECKSCGNQTRFPRYNDPGKLLETRNGRCGEWANCFTLVCRALGYEARHVHDWTDHVWTEIYSDSLKRWLHADSCEAALDTPLVYEQGWGKKLTYCIGFARDHVLDVTKRYTRKFDELLTRRTEFSEQQLKQAMRAISEFATDRAVSELPEDAGAARRAALERRAESEGQELEGGGPKVEVKAEEQVGRTSGDAQWREQRGELGANAAAKAQALELSEKGLAGAAPAAAKETPAAASAAAAVPAPAAAPAPAAPAKAPAPAPAAAPAAPAAAPAAAKTDAQAAFKARFAAHVAAGLPPNEAAVRALQETKEAAGAGEPALAFSPPPRSG